MNERTKELTMSHQT